MVEDLLEQIASLDAPWLLLLAFLFPLGETIALLDTIVPGEVGLIVIGAAAQLAGVPLLAVIAAAAVGAFCGDSISWFIGHRWGTALLTRWPRVWRRVEGPYARAQAYFGRYGGPTVFGARFVGPLRALVPLVAGTSGMPYRRFVPWNVLASVTWVSAVIILGALFGERVASILDRIGLVALGVVMVLGLALWAWHRRRAD